MLNGAFVSDRKLSCVLPTSHHAGRAEIALVGASAPDAAASPAKGKAAGGVGEGGERIFFWYFSAATLFTR